MAMDDPNKNFNFSEHEYDSLRNEVISRIGNVNNQSNSAIITILSTWTMGFALIVALAELEMESQPFSFSCIGSIIFLVPIFYFIPLSIKSGENIQQIASISAYIRVFYEYCSFKRGENLFNWETSNNIYSAVNVNRGRSSTLMIFLNEEYTILSISSLVLYIFTSLSFIKGTAICGFYIAIVSILSLFGIIAICIIHRASCMQNSMMKSTVFYVNAYIERAIELKIIMPEEKDAILVELNPLKYRGI